MVAVENDAHSFGTPDHYSEQEKQQNAKIGPNETALETKNLRPYMAVKFIEWIEIQTAGLQRLITDLWGYVIVSLSKYDAAIANKPNRTAGRTMVHALRYACTVT